MRADDRLISLVRICFAPLAAFTAIFGPLLFLTPGNTGSYWSWEVTPDLSAVWIGATYMFGALALVTMLGMGSWRATIIPVLSTLTFAVAMLVATILHNDRFFTGTIRYAAWLAIYVILPVALTVILVVNRRHDPGRLEGEVMLSRRLRTGLVCAGLAVGVMGLLLVL